MSNEADTCRKFVVPKLQAAGWDSDSHSIAEQRHFTAGRIIVRGNKAEIIGNSAVQTNSATP